MNLQKLSTNVNKKANVSIRRIIIGLCVLTGLVVMGLIIFYSNRDNTKQVQLYSSEVDKAMEQKITFINTVAAGASSGTAKADYYAYVDTMVALYDDVSAVYVCVEEPGTVYADGVMTYMSGGWIPPEDFVVSDRAWYKGALETDGVFTSEVYVDEQSGNICITLSKAIYQDGKVIGVAGLDMFMDDLVSLIENSYDGGNYVFLVSGDGTILTHPNETYAISNSGSTKLADALNGRYAKAAGTNLKNRLIFDYKGGFKLCISNLIASTGWQVVAVSSITWIIIVLLSIIVIAILLAMILGNIAKHQLINGISPMFVPLEELTDNVGKISEGQLDFTFDVDEHSQEVNSLSVALNDTIQGLKNYIAQISDTVTEISEKNLDFDVTGEYPGDYAKIKESLQEIIAVLNDSFAKMNEQAATVLQYSENLSLTSENVAEVATNQSASVINASSDMQKLTDAMEKIREYAVAIKDNTDSTNDRLTIGNQEMNDLVKAMDEIAACYDEIAGFVSEINVIASQTSLLSLNASIEAARAGEAGRGFAVVAGEIGNLAANSSRASEMIEQVIEKSLLSVDKGKKQVAKTDASISESASYSNRNAQMVNEIVNFVSGQKEIAEDISREINSISEMVENNAASAQENSAISNQLGQCAKELMDTIGEFRLKE